MSQQPQPLHLFTKAVLYARYLPEEKFNAIISQINAKSNPSERMEPSQVRDQFNESMAPLGLELTTIRNEFDEDKPYILVKDTKQQPSFVDKVALPQSWTLELKSLIEEALQNDRLTPLNWRKLPNGRFPHKSNLIPYLISHDWLVELPEDRVFLSPKLVYDLEPFFKSHYEEQLPKCVACHKWLLQGRLCPNTECKFRIHSRCSAYFEANGLQEGTCPQCNNLM